MNRTGSTWSPMPIRAALAILLGTAVLFRVAGGEGRSHVAPAASVVHLPLIGTAIRPLGTSLLATTTISRAPAAGWDIPATGGADTYLLPGDDYAAVAARLAPRVESDEAALILMSQAVAICGRPVPPDWRDRARNPRSRAFLEWKESFCNGHVAPAADLAAYYRMRISRFAIDHADLMEENADPGNAWIFDVVMDSDSLEDMQRAADMLDVPGPDQWDLGRDLVQGTPQASRLRRYQAVAVDDLQCARTGGCGPNGFRAVMFCMVNRDSPCHPGQSVYDTWNEEFTPAEIDTILAIKQRILDERSRRAQMRAKGK